MGLKYQLEDVPPHRSLPFLGLQHVLTMLGATVAVPSIAASAFGLSTEESSLLISNVLIAMGIATLIQAKFGTRLPIVQGSSFAFLPAIFFVSSVYTGAEGLAYVSGAVILGALVQVVIGVSGVAGILQRVLTPVVIGPTIMVIGLSLFSVGGEQAATDWPLSLTTIAMILVFSFGAFGLSRSRLGWVSTFPVVLAISAVWLACAGLSLASVISQEHAGYIDFGSIIDSAAVRTTGFFAPWGIPRFDFAFLLVFLIAYIVSTVESIGDYNAINEISRDDPTPLPPGRVDRGIVAEGIGCGIAGLFGSNPTTSYSENIGVVGITRVASRAVVVTAALVLIIAGFFPVVGALLATIPAPIMGGLYCVLFGMISGVGLRYAAKSDLSSMRNVSIIGLALFVGFAVPTAFQSPEAKEALVQVLGQSLGDLVIGLVTSNMAVTALTGLAADNIIPRELEVGAEHAHHA